MAVNEYVELDILKPGTTLVDLTKNFQGRVGDSRAFCKLWIKANGLPYDLTKDGRSVGFAGKDPVGDLYRAVGWADTDQPGDNAQTGRVTYYFPDGMFKHEGDWDKDSTYFYVQDSKGTVSTVNVWSRWASTPRLMSPTWTRRWLTYRQRLTKLRHSLATF